MKPLLYFLYAAALLGCSKDRVQKTATNRGEMEIVWSADLLEHGVSASSMDPVIYKDIVVFSGGFGSYNGVTDPIYFMDSATGEINDYWGNYSYTPYHPFDYCYMVAHDKYLVIGNFNGVDCINLETKSSEWGTVFPVGYGWLFKSFFNGRIYHTQSFVSEGFNKTALLRTPVESCNWDTVLLFEAQVPDEKNISVLAGILNEFGEEVIYFLEVGTDQLSNTPVEERLVAYNISSGREEWKYKLPAAGGSFCSGPVVSSQAVYFKDHRYVYCINRENGGFRWRFDYTLGNPLSDFSKGNILLKGNTLFIKGSDPRLIALNATDGSVIWENRGVGHGISGLFTVFENKLFFCSGGHLKVIDVNTGESLLSEDRQGFLVDATNTVAIDTLRRVLYLSDYRKAFCLKIPNDL